MTAIDSSRGEKENCSINWMSELACLNCDTWKIGFIRTTDAPMLLAPLLWKPLKTDNISHGKRGSFRIKRTLTWSRLRSASSSWQTRTPEECFEPFEGSVTLVLWTCPPLHTSARACGSSTQTNFEQKLVQIALNSAIFTQSFAHLFKQNFY